MLSIFNYLPEITYSHFEPQPDLQDSGSSSSDSNEFWNNLNESSEKDDWIDTAVKSYKKNNQNNYESSDGVENSSYETDGDNTTGSDSENADVSLTSNIGEGSRDSEYLGPLDGNKTSILPSPSHHPLNPPFNLNLALSTSKELIVKPIFLPVPFLPNPYDKILQAFNSDIRNLPYTFKTGNLIIKVLNHSLITPTYSFEYYLFLNLCEYNFKKLYKEKKTWNLEETIWKAIPSHKLIISYLNKNFKYFI